MIYNDAFLGMIGNEPSGNYKNTTHHPFHHKIISVPAETQISMETFRKRQDEVNAGFNGKIGWRLTFQKFDKVLQKGMSIVVASLG